MSCFIMNDTAIATLAEGLARVLNGGYNVYGFSAPETLREALKGCADRYGFFDNVAPIFSELYRLNLAAFTWRYDGRHLEDVDPAPSCPECIKNLLHRPIWEDGRYIVPAAHYHFIQLLECFLYQCDEGPTPKAALYQGLDELKRYLWAFVVHNSAEYKSFNWGEV